MSKAQLAAMPDRERTLLILVAHASNEINVLEKLILMTSAGTPPEKFVDHVEAAQTLIVLRLLIGKLNETWRLFSTRFQSVAGLPQTYLPRLTSKAQDDLAWLRRYFGRENRISGIRNQFAFHTPDDDVIEAAFQDLGETEPWTFYLSDLSGNTFYYAAEMVITRAIAQSAGPASDDILASELAAVFDDTIAVSRKIKDLFSELIALICEQHLASGEPIEGVQLEVPRLPYVPFFLDEDSLKGK
ncbi:hypothetical protein [Hyphomicrobium sp. LHD-15]|uniref:hypothetical protein n=1 Tax=Hyphomicrobium sp. LHD-15 TaxID=3072142 RepID=UPI00280D00A1|nr:hypothetical protein [Hyphomicrobium sp. LHD-15]MDQ8699247.1 hypothetical protein [Hyphomicrobium sp. LHD-15]